MTASRSLFVPHINSKPGTYYMGNWAAAARDSSEPECKLQEQGVGFEPT